MSSPHGDGFRARFAEKAARLLQAGYDRTLVWIEDRLNEKGADVHFTTSDGEPLNPRRRAVHPDRARMNVGERESTVDRRPDESPSEYLRREHSADMGANYGPHDDLTEQAYVKDWRGNLKPYKPRK